MGRERGLGQNFRRQQRRAQRRRNKNVVNNSASRRVGSTASRSIGSIDRVEPVVDKMHQSRGIVQSRVKITPKHNMTAERQSPINNTGQQVLTGISILHMSIAR